MFSSGYEIPATSAGQRITKTKYYVFGGGERDRTDDPLLAKQVLSQLSYTPCKYTRFTNFIGGPNWNRTNDLTLIRGAL